LRLSRTRLIKTRKSISRAVGARTHNVRRTTVSAMNEECRVFQGSANVKIVRMTLLVVTMSTTL
jgi:hypothetical protein